MLSQSEYKRYFQGIYAISLEVNSLRVFYLFFYEELKGATEFFFMCKLFTEMCKESNIKQLHNIVRFCCRMRIQYVS